MNYKIPDKAKIISINDSYSQGDKYEYLEGLLVETDKGNIKLLISEGQCCCENYGRGFLETPDDISKFIGATIKEIKDTNDHILNDECETQLKIITNKGVLQYAVYNEHNGYYSHATFLQVFDVIEENSL